MKRAKKHIVFITFFLIGILIFPLGAKVVHHHEHQSEAIAKQNTPAITEHEGHCLICDFEYLPIERTGVYHVVQIGFVCFNYVTSPINNPVFELFNFSSLRAPPAA